MHPKEQCPMDADRFEQALRRLTTSPSRRQALRGLVGAILGGSVLGGASLVPAAKGKKGGKGKGGGKKKGKGKPTKPQCPASCPVCQQCVDGQSCTPVANDAACNGTGRCLNGTCNPPPNCASPGAFCA